MTTITQMRKELLAVPESWNETVRIMAGVHNSPKDAVEVLLVYLAYDELRGNVLAPRALEALKSWHETRA